MIVWGGVARGGNPHQVGDGAAYDPSSDLWERLPPAPTGLVGGGGDASAWTGTEAVFWVGNSPDGPVGGAVYDPSSGDWRKVAAGPLGIREGYVSVWTGARLLIFGGAAGDQLATPIGAALDPATGVWRLTKSVNELTGFVPSGAVWDGTEAFLLGNQSQCPQLGSACQKYRPMFVSYAPKTNTTEQISLKDAPLSSDALKTLVPAAWTGSRVLFTDLSDTAAPVVTYDPATKAWDKGPPAPCASNPDVAGQTAWIGSQLVAPCGKSRLQLYDPASRTWTVLKSGPSPLNSRTSSAIAWTGSKLIVWSGVSSGTDNPTPNTGTMIDLSGFASG
jgi:hypothetical protein